MAKKDEELVPEERMKDMSVAPGKPEKDEGEAKDAPRGYARLMKALWASKTIAAQAKEKGADSRPFSQLKTANEYIQWRYQGGEDKEALRKDTVKISDEEAELASAIAGLGRVPSLEPGVFAPPPVPKGDQSRRRPGVRGNPIPPTERQPLQRQGPIRLAHGRVLRCDRGRADCC